MAERFDLFCHAIVTIVNSHELTSKVYNHLREKLGEFFQKIESLTDEVSIQQSGSSYDKLHMTWLLKDESGELIFVPATDFDFNIVLKRLLIAVEDEVENCGTDIDRPSTAYFGVLHPSQNPGYVKIRVTQQGRQYLKDKHCDYLFEDIDSEGFINNFSLKRGVLEGLAGRYTVSGPALSDFFSAVKQGVSHDFVYALPVDGWPADAAEWISRDRPNAWPSEDLVARIIADKCMVVPVGHYTSDQSALEWRISFNHSERLLSTSLNHVQRHCYCLTKLLLKTSLPESCILSSYHMKNIFFYMVESQTQLIWENQKIGYLLIEVLKEIVRGLANHNIPNYFIRSNNMIRHRTKEEVKSTLKEVSKLIENPLSALAALLQKLQMYDQK
ncbi:uncharacterized protein LOC110244119, partial [Exaiptasia diaphana]|uniref:Mab-21-like nucleotidyltransferase domain-containing protein n=1 Tax=Exaiptasia diaphana TaxID=2652724 RepID=A0A913YPC2_EXADI